MLFTIPLTNTQFRQDLQRFYHLSIEAQRKARELEFVSGCINKDLAEAIAAGLIAIDLVEQECTAAIQRKHFYSDRSLEETNFLDVVLCFERKIEELVNLKDQFLACPREEIRRHSKSDQALICWWRSLTDACHSGIAKLRERAQRVVYDSRWPTDSPLGIAPGSIVDVYA